MVTSERFPVSTRRRTTDAVDLRTRAALEHHYDAVWRFLRRLGVPEPDVEDAAQRVFLVFARRTDGVASGTERSFLLGTALRVASEARRSRARSTRDVDPHAESKDVEAHVDPAPGPDEQVDARRMRAWLDDVLDALPGELREVLVLVDLEEETMSAASAVLGIPAGTVASRLRRARDAFERSALALHETLHEEVVR